MRFLPFFLTLFSALAAMPAWAEEEAAKKGLPQLDASYFPGQIFWLALTFGVLYILMSRVALPGVARVQKKREDVIAKDLAIANELNETAKKMVAEYEKVLADARAQASVAVNTSAIAQKAAEQQAAQQKVLMQKLREAESRIMTAREAALREARSTATDIANAVIEKITGLKMQAKP